jgi:hypothetical protein
VEKHLIETEESCPIAPAAQATLLSLTGVLLALAALAGFADLAPVVVLTGSSAGVLEALAGLGAVLLMLTIPFLCVLAASWAGVSMLVGAAQVMDLVERRAIARLEAHSMRSRQGAGVVPAPVPAGRGDEVSAESDAWGPAPW